MTYVHLNLQHYISTKISCLHFRKLFIDSPINSFNTGDTWTSADGQQQNQIDYILCSLRWRSSIQAAKTRPGADCGSGHELLIAKFRLKLKNLGKTTKPFIYDLNQIPSDYGMEVTNRFKGLDLIDLICTWRTVDEGSQHCIGSRDKNNPKEAEMKKDKMVVWGGLTNSCEKKRSEKQRRKGDILIWMQSSKE